MILILCLVLLFVQRIKNTKNALLISTNKKAYEEWQYDKVITYFRNHDTKTFNFISQKNLDFLNNLMVWIAYIFLTSVYLLTIIRIDNLTITILSIIQLVTICIHYVVRKYEEYKIETFFDDEKHFYNSKIYFWYFRIDNIFNLILDYVYYPITIIWLLVH